MLKEDEVLGTEEESFMNAYPNPVKDFLNLENFFKPGAAVALYDLHGKKVLEQALQAGDTLLDTRHLESGYYLVKIQYAGGVTKTVKVVRP